MSVQDISQVQLKNQRVLIRADLNVPLKGSTITNDMRIRAALPTIKHAIDQGASVSVVSHLGRPVEGEDNSAYSLEPVRTRLETLLNNPVELESDWLNEIEPKGGSVRLLENIRFHPGEMKNDDAFASALAATCDVYVNDAFGTAHRAHASTCGISNHVPVVCAGLLLKQEVDALEQALENPVRPLVAVIGGAKVSGKLEVLHSLRNIADSLLIGGGMANTFLLASGVDIGDSLAEPTLCQEAQQIQQGVDLPLPVDLMTASKNDNSVATLRLPGEIADNERIVDIGPQTARNFADTIANAGTVIWNGPMGIFEQPTFAEGTRVVAEAIAETDAYTLAGGGDTIAAIETFGLSDAINYISTGGGAFLEFVEGKELPGIAALKNAS